MRRAARSRRRGRSRCSTCPRPSPRAPSVSICTVGACLPATHSAGNSCDIGQVKPELRLVAHELNMSIMAVEYPGYGVSPEVSVANGHLINCRVRATINFLLSLGVDPRSIVLFGRSIGTGPAAAMAAEFKKRGVQVGGVVLQSPYISIHRIIEDYFAIGTWLVSNFWDTEKALREMGPTTPLLLIHGIIDEIIPVYHGQTLYESYNSELKMADFQPSSKHNIYSIIDDLCVPFEKFLSTLSISREAPIVTLRLPQWCLYSCHRLVSGQTVMDRARRGGKSEPQEKQVSSARTHDKGGDSRRTIVRNLSVTECPAVSRKGDVVPESEGDAALSGCTSSAASEPMQVHRTVSKTSFQSSLHDLCESNAITNDDISEIVNDAIARTSNT
ncbi:hydrolase [Babesia caballi]|uniref:Hydrolase n=1 Tax=Babesia caballi TaxID=5871 RepID=A0AAV4LL82_BABCB|nr:hydrolase [Babesia caballi]